MTASTLIIVVLGAALSAWALTGILAQMATKRGWTHGATSSRHIHKEPTPRLGGVAIMATFGLGVLGGAMTGVLELPRGMAGLIVGAMLVHIVGVVDDIVDMRASRKLAGQFLAAGIAVLLGFRIEAVAMGFGSSLDLGLAAVPITMFWLVAVTNAYNLIDGADGLAAGVGMAALSVIALGAFGLNQEAVLFAAVLLGSALLGFLEHNRTPARSFMGDGGSLPVGFMIGGLGVLASQTPGGGALAPIFLLAIAVPLADTAIAIVRRARKGERIWSADAEHLHHKILERGRTHTGASVFLGATQLATGMASLLVAFASPLGYEWAPAAVPAILLGLLAALMVRLGYTSLRTRQPGSEAEVGRPRARPSPARDAPRPARVQEERHAVRS